MTRPAWQATITTTFGRALDWHHVRGVSQLDLSLRERTSCSRWPGRRRPSPEVDLASDDLAPFRRVIQQLL